jgi:hypothetical protein
MQRKKIALTHLEIERERACAARTANGTTVAAAGSKLFSGQRRKLFLSPKTFRESGKHSGACLPARLVWRFLSELMKGEKSHFGSQLKGMCAGVLN